MVFKLSKQEPIKTIWPSDDEINKSKNYNRRNYIHKIYNSNSCYENGFKTVLIDWIIILY